MIGRVLLVLYSAFLLGGIGLYLASRRVDRPIRHSRFIKFVTYFAIVNLFLFGAFAGSVVLTALLAVVVLLGAREIYLLLPRASHNRATTSAAIATAYLLIAVGALLFAWRAQPAVAVFVFLIVCTFDGFSQVSGQMLGRHRLSPRISPGKTIEGSFGGLLFATAMGLLLRPAEWRIPRTVLACAFIAAASLTGDLLASWVKRRSNVKDYGTLIPGHGGILDRFDSFLFAAAACTAASHLYPR